MVDDLLTQAEQNRTEALGTLDATTQSVLGQFFTPARAAALIASIPRLPETGRVRLLDPGAGSGMLSAALVARVRTERPNLSVHVVAVECDRLVVPYLRKTLEACSLAGNGRVTFEWPRQSIRKAQWFAPLEAKDKELLLPEGWYCVVKRFSAKEERRRIVASAWSPREVPGPVAFENHLNVFHVKGAGLDEETARGLTVWTNSTLVDRFFRMFSGHTRSGHCRAEDQDARLSRGRGGSPGSRRGPRT